MATPGIVHLPPGYRVAWVEGSLRLFDVRGELLGTHPAGHASVLAIEEQAWSHVWGAIDREIRQELKQFHQGTRAVGELHRMRQYVRFLEILAEAAPETIAAGSSRRPIPLIARRPFRASKWSVALAVAAVLVFLLVPAEPPSTPLSDVPEPVQEEAASSASPEPAAVSSIGRPGRTARIGETLRPMAGYAMTFGRFTSLKAAQVCARRVRTKGYMATVVPVGKTFRVLGRTYATRTHAERMAKILRGIDLPASVRPVGL